MKITIAIGRQLGSGGSYVGQRIAADLGLRYVDRDVLRLAAQDLNRSEEELAYREERVQSFWEKLADACTIISPPEAHYVPPPVPPLSDMALFHKETEIVKTLATQGDCVLIGRAAVHVLPAHTATMKFFLYAPIDFRVHRVRELYNVPDDQQARTMIAESDFMRQKFTLQMTGHEWMRLENYNLTLDTSLLPLDATANLLMDYIRCRTQIESA